MKTSQELLTKLLSKLEKQARIWKSEPFPPYYLGDSDPDFEEGKAISRRDCGRFLQDLVDDFRSNHKV